MRALGIQYHMKELIKPIALAVLLITACRPVKNNHAEEVSVIEQTFEQVCYNMSDQDWKSWRSSDEYQSIRGEAYKLDSVRPSERHVYRIKDTLYVPKQFAQANYVPKNIKTKQDTAELAWHKAEMEPIGISWKMNGPNY